MSMLVRKATLVRPGRNRRGQSQRPSCTSTASQGGGLFSRTSTSRATFSGVSFLKPSDARKTGSGMAMLASSRLESEKRSKRGGLSPSPQPERQAFLPIPEQTAGLSRHGSSRQYNFSPRAGSRSPRHEDDPEIQLQPLRGRDSGKDSDQTSVRSRDSPRHTPASDKDRNRSFFRRDQGRQLQRRDSDGQGMNELLSRDNDRERQIFHQRDTNHQSPDGQFFGTDANRQTLRKDINRQHFSRDVDLQQRHQRNQQQLGRVTKDHGRQAVSKDSDQQLISRDSDRQQQHRPQLGKGVKTPSYQMLSCESSRHLLSPPGRNDTPTSKSAGGSAPRRQYASSLKESELSKPRSDLPFTRADLPVRHSSLPARRLDSQLTGSGTTAPGCPLPLVLFGSSAPGASPGAASGSGVSSDRPQRHCSLPPRYLELPRSRLDFPLMRPDSEQAFRELAERQQQCRTLIASLCNREARDARTGQPGNGDPDTTADWDHHCDLYQGGDGWRRTSVDNCQRSELLQQVVEANKEADNPCDFVCRVYDIVSTTVLVTVLLFGALTIPVIMISVGVKYMNDCPLDPRLPVYLLVGGCFLALKLLGMLWKNVQLRRYDNMDAFYDSPDSELAFTSRTFRIMDWILAAFLLAWHVVGAFWVFALWRPPYRPKLHEPSRYCDSTVYLCAAGEIIFTGAFLLLGMLCCFLLALCYKYTSIFEQ